MSINRFKIHNPLQKAALLTAIMVLWLLALFACVNKYSKNLELLLFRNASQSIEESYNEVASQLKFSFETKWNYLKILGDYFDAVKPERETFKQAVSNYRDICDFTDLYLIDENGGYMTPDGDKGYIDLGDKLMLLAGDSDNILVDASLPNHKNMLFFVVNVPDNSYEGFDFIAMAFGFDAADIGRSLKCGAFGNQSFAYLTYANGKIAARVNSESTEYANIFTIIRSSEAGDALADEVESDYEEGGTGTFDIGFNDEGIRYYFSYQPLGYLGLMVASFTPETAVNNTISLIRSTTSNMIIAIFAMLVIPAVLIGIIAFINIVNSKNKAIHERETVFTTAAKSLDEVYILYAKRTGTISYVSPNTERLLGVSGEQFKADPDIIEVYVDDKLKTFEAFIGRDLHGRTFTEEVYLRNDSFKGDRMFQLSVYDDSEQSDYRVLVLSDRTEERRIRQEMLDAINGANAANAAKTAFLSSMSHDIRTPMNAIIGFSSLVESNITDTEKVLDYNSKIISSSRYLLNLINDILDYSKIESGKSSLSLAAVDILTVIRRIDSMMRPLMIDKGHEFIIDSSGCTDCIVNADDMRLTQIMNNLLSNAVKYTPDNGRIVLTVSNTVGDRYSEYTFCVEDNGMGMSEEFVKNIYEPFSRETKSTVNKIQGTGLGMAITKNLVDLMGGTIETESKEGVGTKFTMILNFALAEDENEQLPRSHNNNNNNNGTEYSIAGLNILVAEDNELNAEIITELLKAQGATVTIASDGKAAYEMFIHNDSKPYDVILMDVQMPVMDGYQSARAIRGSHAANADTIPIIAATANAYNEDVHNALAAGMNAHVAKPIDMHVLKKTICELLERSH